MNYAAIRQQSSSYLREAGVPLHPHLPLLDGQPHQTASDVARRIVALYCLAGLANGASGPAMRDWVTEERLEGCFDAEEWELLRQEDVSDAMQNELSWCQESLYAAAWSINVVPRLEWPIVGCNLKPVFPLIPPEVAAAPFIENVRLRDEQVLVQLADLYYCMDSSLRHDELWGGEPVESRYPTVQITMARRRVLDWILSDVAWRDVAFDI